LGRITGKILLRATAAFGLSYIFWLVFYFDFLKESLESVSPLIEPSALVNVPLSILGSALAVALIIAIATCRVGTTSFIRGVVIVGVVLSISSLVSIGLGSPLAWASLALAVAALFAVWKWQVARLVGLALLCGILGTGYALLTQGLWAWANWPAADTESPAAVSIDSPEHNLPSVYVVVMEETSMSALNKYASLFSLPNVSRLAEEGVFFPRAYAIYDGTEGSIPSLFSGRYLEEDIIVRQTRNSWLDEYRNLVSDLASLGYQVKVYNDFFNIRSRIAGSILKTEAKPSAVVSGDDLSGFALNHFLRQVSFGLFPAPNIGALLQGQPARVFFLEHSATSPKFVYIHLFDSHKDYLRNRDGTLHQSPHVSFDDAKDEASAEKVAENYFEQILWADQLLGPLVDSLLRIPPEERIVLFTADHGVSWREPPYGRTMGALNSTQVHVPVVLSAPGLAPAVEPQLLPLIDLYPTIIDLLNKAAGKTVLATPDDIDGLSLFADPARRQDREYYAYSGPHKYRLDGDQWILVHSFEGTSPPAKPPFPAQELALTEEAVQLALDSAVVKPLPPMDPGRQRVEGVSPQLPTTGGKDTEELVGPVVVTEDDAGVIPETASVIEIFDDDCTIWDWKSSVFGATERQIVKKGAYSLKVTWENENGAIYYNFAGQDWSANEHVSFYVYGAGSGDIMLLQLRSMGPAVEDWAQYRWRDDFEGWRRLTFELRKPTLTSGFFNLCDVCQVVLKSLRKTDAILYFDYLVRY